MAFSIEITRPDDLLRLRIEGRNVRVHRGADGDALVVEDSAHPAFLLIHFPPQSIAERAYYEAKSVKVDVDPPPPAPPTPAPPPAGEVPPPPGSVTARLSHGSRLAFRLPSDTRIPLTIEGLLDWSGFELSVNAIAALGAQPSPAQVAAAPAIARPAETETALELPYRLVISPTAAVRWVHRRAPFTSKGRTELWHTRLQRVGDAGDIQELTQTNPASLRAIWSEDYNTRDGLNPSKDDPDLGRAAMTPNDRHQIVVKTSAFHGYEGESTLKLGGLVALGGSVFGGGGFELKHWRPYVPQPFYAEQVMLSCLGGWLRSQGHWPVVRKAAARLPFEALDVSHIVGQLAQARRAAINVDPAARADAGTRMAPAAVGLRPEWIDALRQQPSQTGPLDLSEWQHIAAQGRDHYVRIVYEGELLPFHHRASLVKVTERKFKDVGGLVVANLYQRNFIVVREPEKSFGTVDRGMPFKKVRLTTLVTPDLSPPQIIAPTGRSFWVEVYVAPGQPVRFPFHAVGTDIGGSEIDFTIPLLFASRGDDDKRTTLIEAYNISKTSAQMADRSAKLTGQKVRFAQGAAGTPSNNALLATRSMTFALDGEAPRLLKADVNVPQVQELLGKDAPSTIRLYPGFVAGGLDTGSGVFAEVVRETPTASADPFAAVSPTTLDLTFSSDKAGGFATPNMGVSTLTQKAGPLAGDAADAVADTFKPASFFPKGPGAALLFGTFELADLLVTAPIAGGAPLMRTHPEEVDGVKMLVTTLDWQAEVDNLPLPPKPAAPIAEFRKSATTKLDVHGRIEKILDPAGAPNRKAVSRFNGTLNDFSVTLLGCVEVNFVSFSFSSTTDAKPSVGVTLTSDHPLRFTGDLQFVEELRNAIPPGLFGDASIDVLPNAIRAGFSFALPPVSVGVFSLKDVSLGAGLTLPFLDGRPSLDFNVSERPHPFLLAVGIFGGGGFFHLQLDTAGLKIVEAALEFGVTASVDLGVASGGVHIMAGIYFKLERKEPANELAPTLTGYLRMGGHMSVLGLIKLSLEFTLSFTYDGARDKAYGRATLTVQVEIVFFSVSVEITVERAFGGSGDPLFKQLFTTAQPWHDYAEAFA